MGEKTKDGNIFLGRYKSRGNLEGVYGSTFIFKKIFNRMLTPTWLNVATNLTKENGIDLTRPSGFQ